MSTRSNDQQKKQRQKEFKERKEHLERKMAAKKSKQDPSGTDDETDTRSEKVK